MRFYAWKIVSYCIGLRTQNPVLIEAELEPIYLMGSDRINMLK